MLGRIAIRGAGFLFLLGSVVLAQDSSPAASAPSAQASRQSQAQGAGQLSSPQAGDDLAQIRDDLNKMDSLNMNMSSEIEFLHDQNLQILLRTNSQMWTVLIRDLRRQVARQEQLKATPPAVKK
jgi:hypothetical protein